MLMLQRWRGCVADAQYCAMPCAVAANAACGPERVLLRGIQRCREAGARPEQLQYDWGPCSVNEPAGARATCWRSGRWPGCNESPRGLVWRRPSFLRGAASCTLAAMHCWFLGPGWEALLEAGRAAAPKRATARQGTPAGSGRVDSPGRNTMDFPAETCLAAELFAQMPAAAHSCC